MDELIGKTIQNYEIVDLLGRGGMGVVYKAYDKNLDRHVAIKMLLPQVMDKSVIIERFKREAKNQAKLSHPNIVTVYGFTDFESKLGIVMEYVDGESIEQIIFRQKRLHLFDAVYIMKNALAGIAHAHAKGFIHRDIKPSNILLSTEGEIKIMDFGISKSLIDKGMTKTGAKVGTVYYMSPEQIRGEKITHHADIYAVGCSFYEMITGVPPFDLESEYEVMDAHLKKDPAKISSIIPGTPPLLDKIITKALKKLPGERYESANEFIADLTELEKYLNSINAETHLKIKKRNNTSKFLSIFAFSSLILLFLALAYFAYIKVDELIRNDQIEQFKKFNIQTLFKDQDSYKNLDKINIGSNENINSIQFLENGFGYAVGTSGKVWLSNDKGITWKSYNTPEDLILYDSYVFNDGRSFIIGENSTIYFSKYFFNDLERIDIPINSTLFRIKFVDDLTGFICGSNGTILKTIDGGKTWDKKATDTKYLLYDISFPTEKIGIAVGWAGTILRSVDGGETWHSLEQMTQKYIRSVDFYDDEIGFAVGGNEMFYSNDAGESWQEIEVPANIRGMRTVKFVDDDILFIAGMKGLLFVSQDGGRNWREINTGAFINLNRITKLNESELFAAGDNGKLLKIH